MGIVAPMVIDSERVSHAAALYNNVRDMLTEAGWREELEECNRMFWPDGKPTGIWRHEKHPGAFSMDAAFVVVAQAMPRRG